MFTASRDEVTPRERAMRAAEKVILTIFFSGVSLITLNALPSGARFNQECFVNHILPDIFEARGRFSIHFVGENVFCTWTIPWAIVVAR
jgi:hypothetical protein